MPASARTARRAPSVPAVRDPAGRRPAARAPRPVSRDASSVERLYLDLRARAMRYDFRPGARINEQALGREYGVSRAPLREALNRLAAEGLLDFAMNRGFSRKAVSIEEVVDLYQVRSALERQAVSLAIARADDAAIDALAASWRSVMDRAASVDIGDLLLEDERFHAGLAALSGNRELCAMLDTVARRIHVARHIDLEQSDWNAQAFQAHAAIVERVRARDLDGALARLDEHLGMSLQRAIAITREMAARLFVVDHDGTPRARG